MGNTSKPFEVWVLITELPTLVKKKTKQTDLNDTPKHYSLMTYLGKTITTKLLGAEVKNSQVILRIVLPILKKFLQKSQIYRVLFARSG